VAPGLPLLEETLPSHSAGYLMMRLLLARITCCAADALQGCRTQSSSESMFARKGVGSAWIVRQLPHFTVSQQPGNSAWSTVLIVPCTRWCQQL